MKLPRQLIKGRFKETLSQADLRFIITTLTRAEVENGEADSLLKLLTDGGMRDVILDSEKIFEAAKKCAGPPKISRELYFYILLRRALKKEGIDSADVAAFLAEALAKFPPAPRPGVHTADYVEAIQNTKDYEWFILNVELANRTLVLSGVYSATLYQGKKNYTVSGLNYYESLGKSCYRGASRHQLADEFELKDVLRTLSDDYVKVRGVLEAIKDDCIRAIEGGE